MQGSTSTGNGSGRVQVISRRVVRAESPPLFTPEEIHLTPWDLTMITLNYIQHGVLLPKPESVDSHQAGDVVVDRLAPAFGRALGRFYPLAGRLVLLGERGTDEGGSTASAVSLRCTGEGAEFVHAAAPGVSATDVTARARLHIPRELVSPLFPLNGLLCVEAASSEADADGGSGRGAPLLAAQVTELTDAIFIAVSLNHAVGDGATFWDFVNTWSDLARSDGAASERPPPPNVLKRWFPDNCPVPVPLQFAKVEHAVRRRGPPLPLQACSLYFPAESVKKLKARANDELAAAHSTSGTAAAIAAVSSLQALLAHLWRSVCRARRLEASQKTTYVLLVRCRGRVKGIPLTGYVGNAVVPCKVTSTAGEVLEKGLGWTSWLLNSAVASFDEAALVRGLDRWPAEQTLAPAAGAGTSSMATVVTTGSSPRFDVYGNDFGWGKPVAVRSGPGNKADGESIVYEGRAGGSAMNLEVCLAPDALARLLADDEFMDAVAVPP